MNIDLRHGDWRSVLGGVEADAVITDPPYSKRTVAGQRSFKSSKGYVTEATINYSACTEADMRVLCAHWAPRVRRWFVMFGDHYMMRWAEDELRAAGLYVFAPLPWCKTDAAPRFCSDGPSPQSESIIIARPRRRMARPEKRFRKGWYCTKQSRDGIVTGGKPLDLMRTVVRDYSEPGDLIVDPYAGGATTLIAAALEGRRSIGAEISGETFGKAIKRISDSRAAEVSSA